MNQKYGKKYSLVCWVQLWLVRHCRRQLPCSQQQKTLEMFYSLPDLKMEKAFLNLPGVVGVEVMEATTDQAYSGNYSMCVSGREKGWNGPQFRLGRWTLRSK